MFCTQAVLRALHQSVVQGGLTADGVPDYGAQVPCAQLVCRRLRESTWPLLQLVLLEGRVLLVSKSAARASAAVWGLASLLPGAIGAGLGHYRSATDAPRFRWTRFGLPLALFSDGHGSGGGGGSGGDGSSAASASGVVADPGTDTSRTHSHNQVSNSSSSNSSRRQRVEYVCLAPLVPMADASRVFGHSSYLAGTANQMVREASTEASFSFPCEYNLSDESMFLALLGVKNQTNSPSSTLLCRFIIGGCDAYGSTGRSL